MFTGCITALVTPFKSNNTVDYQSLSRLIESQIAGQINGLVMCGTTGESPTLTEPEKIAIFKHAVKQVKHRIPIIAGTGSNDTEHTIRLTKKAEACGVDGVLIVTPYYNKPTQEGLYQHFKAIAKSVKLPIIIYNIPARTGVNMLPVTMARLHKEFPKIIIGVKEAAGSLDQATEIVKRCGKTFTLLSGDDSLTLPMLSIGGKGVISVIANIVPKLMNEMTESYFKGDTKKANEPNQKLFPLYKTMFIETNPIPIKYAMSVLGMPSGRVRLPLTRPLVENQRLIRQTLQQLHISKIKY